MSSISANPQVESAVRRRIMQPPAGASERLFQLALMGGIAVALIFLVTLLIQVAVRGVPGLSLSFLTDLPSSDPAKAGVGPALVGTLWMLAGVTLIAFPLGVATAVYLEEYAGDTRLTRLIRTNIQNLAGVPSIVYGLLGLAFFVRFLGAFTGGRSIIAGALTLSLLVLPVIVIASVEALRAVPKSMRDASFGLGATRWETTRRQVLPAALPGILTGVILSLSRAIGETAPLITIGALTFVNFFPSSPTDSFTVLPIQAFNWISQPQSEFHDISASAIVVLLVLLLSMNTIAILLRRRFEKRW
jgi:phosphate transport system permease protein